MTCRIAFCVSICAAAVLMPFDSHAVAAEPGERLSLLRADGSALPIVVAQDAAPHTRAAAEELAVHLQAIGGVLPKLIDGRPDPLPTQAIWVGYQKALDGLFPGANFTLTHPEEIFLVGNENHIAITGRDKWDPKFSELNDDRNTIPNKQQECGTANAVYTFLQDRMGVRWLYPGESGTDYPAKESLHIQPFTYRYHPQFRARAGLFAQLDASHKRSVQQDWVKHQRVLLDSFYIEGGHSFKRWWEKYGDTRPELFALQPDGTRGTFPADPESKKFCVGEPAVWQTWLDEMAERFARYPYWNMLPTQANDGYYSGHCTDPRSRAWDPAPSESKITIELNWANGHTEAWPPLSDRYANFANKLSELAAKRFPDRDFLVSMSAYGEVGRPAPVKTKLRDNILVVSVHNFHMRNPAERTAQMQQFSDWAKVSKHLVWRPNLGNQAGLQWGFPDVPFHQAMEDFRFVAKHGTIGVFFDMYFENWGNLAPHYYLVSQLAWNPYQDGEVVLDDYFQRCYGPAATTMKNYWMFLEKTRQHFVDAIESAQRVAVIQRYYTADVLKQAEAFLAEAERLAAGDPKYAARVQFTRCGFTYAQALVEQRDLMSRFEAGKSKDKQLERVIRDKWTALGETVATFPEDVVRFKRMDSTKRAAGLHPDAPISRKMLRDILGLDAN